MIIELLSLSFLFVMHASLALAHEPAGIDAFKQFSFPGRYELVANDHSSCPSESFTVEIENHVARFRFSDGNIFFEFSHFGEGPVTSTVGDRTEATSTDMTESLVRSTVAEFSGWRSESQNVFKFLSQNTNPDGKKITEAILYAEVTRMWPAGTTEVQALSSFCEFRLQPQKIE